MTSLKRKWKLAVTATLVAASGATLAGGGDEDSSNDFATEGPSYFGFVWDTRGVTIPGARVVLRAQSGKTVEAKTNAMGMYRTHVSKDAKPEEIALTCDKDGYKHSKFMRRTHPGTSPNNIELDCVVAKK